MTAYVMHLRTDVLLFLIKKSSIRLHFFSLESMITALLNKISSKMLRRSILFIEKIKKRDRQVREWRDKIINVYKKIIRELFFYLR